LLVCRGVKIRIRISFTEQRSPAKHSSRSSVNPLGSGTMVRQRARKRPSPPPHQAHSARGRRRGVSKKGTSAVESTFLLGTQKGLLVTVLTLFLARVASAAFNIIHDCDETYNYWEPLHYLIYNEGFQTWEYR